MAYFPSGYNKSVTESPKCHSHPESEEGHCQVWGVGERRTPRTSKYDWKGVYWVRCEIITGKVSLADLIKLRYSFLLGHQITCYRYTQVKDHRENIVTWFSLPQVTVEAPGSPRSPHKNSQMLTTEKMQEPGVISYTLDGVKQTINYYANNCDKPLQSGDKVWSFNGCKWCFSGRREIWNEKRIE